jgi:signal transduction histidine kinase
VLLKKNEVRISPELDQKEWRAVGDEVLLSHGEVDAMDRGAHELLKGLKQFPDLRMCVKDHHPPGLRRPAAAQPVAEAGQPLCAELDDTSDYVRRAGDLRSRFLSNITHEFRTPVNAIVGLCNLLRDDKRRKGHEPEPELDFILKAAGQLSTLVNDLLDLAKAEAGKTILRPATFEVQNLFGALLGMLRPLLPNRDVALSFEDVAGLPPIHTDEARVSQILRNLISNSLKFTERGEVRVSASVDEEAGVVTFRVSDTGIGIATDDQAIIFEEFEQIEHHLQRSDESTGVGLPLSRRLAQLLGGSLDVASEPGVGSVFSVMLPVAFVAPAGGALPFPWTPNPSLPVHAALGLVRPSIPDLTES